MYLDPLALLVLLTALVITVVWGIRWGIKQKRMLQVLSLGSRAEIASLVSIADSYVSVIRSISDRTSDPDEIVPDEVQERAHELGQKAKSALLVLDCRDEKMRTEAATVGKILYS
jgi:hypothetical protein